MLRDEKTRLNLEHSGLTKKIKENKEKIKLGNQLPYLVGNIVEVLDVSPDDEEVRGLPTQSVPSCFAPSISPGAIFDGDLLPSDPSCYFHIRRSGVDALFADNLRTSWASHVSKSCFGGGL